MHPDPTRGVVEVDDRLGAAPVLGITGSSTFPTGGRPEPTLTSLTFTLRLGDQPGKATLSDRLADARHE